MTAAPDPAGTAFPTVLVTRPAAQAPDWVRRLREAGVPALALPLVAIGPAPDPAAVAAAWRALSSPSSPPAAVMFVSPSAVQAFLGAGPGTWPEGVDALATGPGTAAALREGGVPSGNVVAPPPDAPRFDSEALWAVCGSWHWQGRPAWIVRGNCGRDWFADRLREAGAHVYAVAAYMREDVAWDAAQRAACEAACRAPARHAWLFSSSDAIERLRTLRPGQDWSGARALATHPRIAEAARAAGFGRVEDVGASPDAIAAHLRASAAG